MTLDRMQSEGNANHFVSIGLNFGILLISIFPTWIVLSELDHTHEIRVVEDEFSKTGKQHPAGGSAAPEIHPAASEPRNQTDRTV